MLLISNEKLNYIQTVFFNLFTTFSYLLLIISLLGISQTATEYLVKLSYYIRIYICLFLIWRFNPFRSNYEFTDLDRKIAFSAGVFILSTTALNKYLIYAENTAKKFSSDITVDAKKQLADYSI